MSLSFNIKCPICAVRNRDTNMDSPIGEMKGSFNVENYGVGTCSLFPDHQQYVFLANPRYEILIRQGVDAYIDGYYLESFMKFYQALENFRRIFVEASLYRKNPNERIFELSQSSLKNSTILYGAYQYAYFHFFHEVPDTKGSTHNLQMNHRHSIIEYRNNVVHNGKHPTKLEIEKIGQIIIQYIQDIEFNFGFKVNIGQKPVKFTSTKHTIKLSDIPTKEGLAPIIPEYTGSLMQDQIHRYHRTDKYWILVTEKNALLTIGDHYPGDTNKKNITFNEYVELRKAPHIDTVF